MDMGKALIGFFCVCALLVLLVQQGGERPEPLDLSRSAEVEQVVEASTLVGAPDAEYAAPTSWQRRVVSGSGRLRVVHAEGLGGMQGCRLRINGGEELVTDGDGAVPERKWPVGSVLSCEVDVDGDGDTDETLTHRVGGGDEPLAIGGWATFEFQQAPQNRAAYPLDSVGWSKRFGPLKEVGGVQKPREPMRGSSRPWVRIPAQHLSLRSDWLVVARSGAIVDFEHMLQRYGLQVIQVNMVPVGSLRVNFVGGEPLNLKGSLHWLGPAGEAPKIDEPRWNTASGLAQWRKLPIGPYELRLTSLIHEPWRGRLQIEIGRNEQWVGLAQGRGHTITCTVDAPPDDPQFLEKLPQIQLVLSEGADRWVSVVLKPLDVDSPLGQITYQGPSIREGKWTVERRHFPGHDLLLERQEWSGQTLRLRRRSAQGEGSSR